MIEKLRTIFWFAGVAPEDFLQCQPDVAEDNRKKLRLYLMIAAGFLFVCFCLSGGVKVLRPYSLAYGTVFLVMAGLALVDMMFPERNGLFLTWLMYAVAAALYVLGIAIAMITPDRPTVEFVAFSLTVPLLFTMPPIQHIGNIVFFDLIFILLAAVFESGDAKAMDIVAVVLFGAVSCVISTLMMHSNYQKFVATQKLRAAANYDLLTGVKNRNAFEEERLELKEKITLSLGCVYVDANGLHTLNNTRGHESGDQMLQAVALTMQELFGRKNCYRIGGDEFVAIVRNGQDGTVRNSGVFLKKEMEKMGYSIAVGTATQKVEELDVDGLFRLAEKRMYQNKMEYYSSGPQTGR